MKFKNILGLGVTTVIMLSGIWLLTHQQEITDWWRLRDYEPSPQVSQLVIDSGMNEKGKRLFYVHSPELLDKSQFNGKCDIGEETIVLGCYISHDKIYVFNVDDERLSGIEEVTAAHEMLHAVYDRLPNDEKSKLDELLLSTYQSLNDERLNRTIESYKNRDESIVGNELHSILGTEVRDLPAELEEYYSQYFEDRTVVVTLAEAYELEFTNLENQIEQFDSQLESLSAEINQLESNVEQLGSALSIEQQQLEARRSNTEEYNAAVPVYNAKVRDYNRQINELKVKINQYNELVNTRNAIAIEEQDLIKTINSNYQEL